MTTETKSTPQTGRERLAIYVSDDALAFKRRTLERLSADLLTKPAHALRCADLAFNAAAGLAIAAWMQKALTIDASLEQMRAEAEKKARHFAQYPGHSTSPLANLSDEEEGVAWMDILLKIEAAIEHDARVAAAG